MKQPISSGWVFKQADAADSTFKPVSQFPTVIHLDLINQGTIPDPFLDSNEKSVQWVGEREWIYKTVFIVDTSSSSQYSTSELVFDGLDTHATVYLNGESILIAENMFSQYRVDITDKLQGKTELYELLIHFKSTFFVGKQLEKEHGSKFLYWNGDSSRLAVRKAPYHYGWDWGLRTMTCGPWKPIWLERFNARIDNVYFETDFSEDYSIATIIFTCEVKDGDSLNAKFFLEENKTSATVVASTVSEVHDGRAKSTVILKNPDLWYPVGYGKQSLYVLKTVLESDDSTVDSRITKIGLRKVELVQEPLPEEYISPLQTLLSGTSFYFKINGIPIFCKGTDWIPSDSFLPRVNSQKLKDWIQFTVDGNQNMVRVWGGGVYEDDSFYDACDELGVLVWNDFQLACGSYPTDKKYLGLIEDEAVYNVKRTRNHPSVVLWCGNNEDYMFAEIHNLEYDPNDSNPDNWLKTNFSARYIYEKLLKDICEKYCPQIPYHYGSPWAGKTSNSSSHGDTHSWNVWMADGQQLPYQEYYKLAGRFVSEFGMKSYPNMKTIKEFISDERHRYPQSKIMDDHQKAPKDQSSLAVYLIDNFKHGYSMEKYVYATQLLQAEALSCAYQSWRRLWKGPGKCYCGGILVWQLNDCWPVVSWSLVDYYLRPKAAYFTVKRDIASVSIGVFRRTEEVRHSEFTDVDIDKTTIIEVWGSNFTLKDIQADLALTGYALDGQLIWSKTVNDVVLKSNRTTEFLVEKLLGNHKSSIIFAKFTGENNTTLAVTSNWPQPLKYLDLGNPHIDVSVEGDIISLRSSVPVKGLIFDLEHDEVKFSDNCLDLEPHIEQRIVAENLNGRPVKFLHLGIAN